MPEEFELLIRLSRCNDKEEMGRCIDDYNASKKCITNADRIRAMSDEELAGFLADDNRTCPPHHPNCGKYIDGCTGCFFEWLQKPTEA